MKEIEDFTSNESSDESKGNKRCIQSECSQPSKICKQISAKFADEVDEENDFKNLGYVLMKINLNNEDLYYAFPYLGDLEDENLNSVEDVNNFFTKKDFLKIDKIYGSVKKFSGKNAKIKARGYAYLRYMRLVEDTCHELDREPVEIVLNTKENKVKIINFSVPKNFIDYKYHRYEELEYVPNRLCDKNENLGIIIINCNNNYYVIPNIPNNDIMYYDNHNIMCLNDEYEKWLKINTLKYGVVKICKKLKDAKAYAWMKFLGLIDTDKEIVSYTPKILVKGETMYSFENIYPPEDFIYKKDRYCI